LTNDCLVDIAGMDSLESLNLVDTYVTDQDLAELRKKLPRLKVVN
jgi:hypothetical protein